MPLSYSGPGPLYGRNARWKDEFTDLLLPLRTTLPGKRDGRRETDSKEKTEEKTDMAPLEPMYSISSLLRAIFSKRVLFPTFWTFPDKRMLLCFRAAIPYNSWSAFDMQWSLHNMKQGNWMSSTLLSFCQEDTQLAFDRKLEWRYVTKIWSTRWLTFQGYSTNWDQLGQIAAILRVRLPKSIESCEPVSHITLLADCSVNIIMLR